ncbi:MAG: CHAP domain-containing protein [Acidimicrobiales bacterium]
MAAGRMHATRNWAGWFPPLAATSAALLIPLAVLGPLSSGKLSAASGPAPALQRATTAQSSISRDVAAPSWWKGGTCDPTNYPGSHPLGASWHGLVACGPGPTQGGSDHPVDFFPGAWGELEWECVELSMRWMYLAWGVNPYPADGWAVVRDYDLADYKAKYNPNGPQLITVDNDTIGAVPQPGDVISIARSQQNSYGHTSVATANAVDAQGNGTITVIQQNGGTGNDGWATYPVSDWDVGDGVSGWLHNPAWTFQRPLVGYTSNARFEARIAAPGNSYELVSTGAGAIDVAGGTGAMGTDGGAIYGYIDQDGNFFVKRAASTSWTLAATHAASMAVAITGSGAPVLAYLSTSGDFYAEQGSLGGSFSLEATKVASIAVAGGSGTALPLLGYLESGTNAFFVKSGLASDDWTVVQPGGVRSIALAEASTAASALVGYVSDNGTFYARQLLGQHWTEEATAVSAISLAVAGSSAKPLLGYLSGDDFFAAESLTPATWVKEASGVGEIAVASGQAPGALPVLGYLTTGGDLEVSQGPLTASFTLQAVDASSLALSSLTDT